MNQQPTEQDVVFQRLLAGTITMQAAMQRTGIRTPSNLRHRLGKWAERQDWFDRSAVSDRSRYNRLAELYRRQMARRAVK